MEKFTELGLDQWVIDNLAKKGFTEPSPIQAQAIPAVMSGKDLIGIAKTGSGKTLAFLIPMFRHIIDQPQLEEDDGPIGEKTVELKQQCSGGIKIISTK